MPRHGLKHLLKKHSPGILTGAGVVGGSVALDQGIKALRNPDPGFSLPSQEGEENHNFQVSDSSWNLLKFEEFEEEASTAPT